MAGVDSRIVGGGQSTVPSSPWKILDFTFNFLQFGGSKIFLSDMLKEDPKVTENCLRLS